MRAQRFESPHDRQALLFQRGMRGAVVFLQDAGEFPQLMNHHIFCLRQRIFLMHGAIALLKDEAGTAAGLAMQRDAARIALDLRDAFAAAVLGASKGSDEVRIPQYAAAAGVDAIVSAVRKVMDFLGSLNRPTMKCRQ